MRKICLLLLVLSVMIMNLSFVCYGAELPTVRIISPVDGQWMSLSVTLGMNNPSPKYAPVYITLGFEDEGYEFEKLEVYKDDHLIITSSEKNTRYLIGQTTYMVDISGILKVACYYKGDIKAESNIVHFETNTGHIDRHYTLLEGSVIPDIPGASENPLIMEGFSIYSTLSDSKGNFSILTPDRFSHYITITKKNYLTATIQPDTYAYNQYMYGVIMMPGDIEIDGVQDGVINLQDIMEIAKRFNAGKGQENYDQSMDFNLDGVINIQDIVIVAKNFNVTSPTVKALTTPRQ